MKWIENVSFKKHTFNTRHNVVCLSYEIMRTFSKNKQCKLIFTCNGVIDIISNKYSYKTMTLQIMLVFRDSCDIQNLS